MRSLHSIRGLNMERVRAANLVIVKRPDGLFDIVKNRFDPPCDGASKADVDLEKRRHEPDRVYEFTERGAS